MAHIDIFPADDSGVSPSIDPISQKLESVVINDVKHWKITNYSIEEANDGSQLYADILISIRNRKISRAEKAKSSATDQQDQQDLSSYITTLEGCTQFPVGFTFPAEPACLAKYEAEIHKLLNGKL